MKYIDYSLIDMGDALCNMRPLYFTFNLYKQEPWRPNIMEANNNPLANPSLVLREEFDDWAVLFDPDTGDSFGLNPVSVFIFKRLDGRTM